MEADEIRRRRMEKIAARSKNSQSSIKTQEPTPNTTKEEPLKAPEVLSPSSSNPETNQKESLPKPEKEVPKEETMPKPKGETSNSKKTEEVNWIQKYKEIKHAQRLEVISFWSSSQILRLRKNRKMKSSFAGFFAFCSGFWLLPPFTRESTKVLLPV